MPFIAAIASTETPEEAARRAERVARADLVVALRRGAAGDRGGRPAWAGAVGARRARARRGRRGRRGRIGGREPGVHERGVALDRGRDLDRLPEHDLAVLGQPVEGGDGAGGQVVGRRRSTTGSRRVPPRGAPPPRRGRRAGPRARRLQASVQGFFSSASGARRDLQGFGRTWPVIAEPRRASTRPRVVTTPCKTYCAAHAPRRPEAVGPEMALVRACEPAVEPRSHPFRVRPPPFLLPLARARKRARDAPGGPARARRARAARAGRVAHRSGARPDPHRRRQLPQPRRAGRGGRARRDRRALHVRQRLLRHRRQPPLRRPREARAVAGLHAPRARPASATTSGAAPTS